MNIKIKPNNYVPKEPELREEVVQGLVDYLLRSHRGISYNGRYTDRYLHYDNDTGKPWIVSHDTFGSSKKVVRFNRDEVKKAVELLQQNGYHLKKKVFRGTTDIAIMEWPGSNSEWTAVTELPKEPWEE